MKIDTQPSAIQCINGLRGLSVEEGTFIAIAPGLLSGNWQCVLGLGGRRLVPTVQQSILHLGGYSHSVHFS